MFYAHTVPDIHPEEGWQQLAEHLQGVAKTASESAHWFGSSEWAHNASWLHDIGKADPVFQAYLYRENGLAYDDDTIPSDARVNHSSTGAALAEEMYGIHAGRILAYLVAGHHAGLPDWESCDTGQAALQHRLVEGRRQLERIRSYIEPYAISNSPILRPPKFVNSANCHLWVRMLFSCLVDADFLDTEAFLKPKDSEVRARFSSLDELANRFDRHMKSLIAHAPDTVVNHARKRILDACIAKATESSGLFSLTVPTGGGKTLSAIAFALRHALKQGMRRIIYVIPYTSIVEQTSQTLASIFGAENIVEHHSNLEPDRETRQSRLAAENWDAPIIITTNVQFFESLYAARTSRCRKLHNIVNSVVILDEAQLLPPELLTPCVDVMNQLTRHFRVTMLLTTATQPVLPGLDRANEIIDSPTALYQTLKRTEIVFPETLRDLSDWESISSKLMTHEQVLCVVNTRKDCLDLFRMMPAGTVHLSALMCGAHRSKVIACIKQRLTDGATVRVISTQLVEAGVDMDFPVVYRALAGVDSIVQAAGRCNREGKLNVDGRLGVVYVFVPPKPAPRGLLRKGEDTTRELFALEDFDLDNPEQFTRYFTLFYNRVNDMGSDFYDWLVRDANPGLSFHFRTAADRFKMIDDLAYRSVFVLYDEAEKLLDQLRILGPRREVMRKLQRYVVNVPKVVANGMIADGLIQEIYPGLLVQSIPSMYDCITGLDIRRSNPEAEDLVV